MEDDQFCEVKRRFGRLTGASQSAVQAIMAADRKGRPRREVRRWKAPVRRIEKGKASLGRERRHGDACRPQGQKEGTFGLLAPSCMVPYHVLDR